MSEFIKSMERYVAANVDIPAANDMVIKTMAGNIFITSEYVPFILRIVQDAVKLEIAREVCDTKARDLDMFHDQYKLLLRDRDLVLKMVDEIRDKKNFALAEVTGLRYEAEGLKKNINALDAERAAALAEVERLHAVVQGQNERWYTHHQDNEKLLADRHVVILQRDSARKLADQHLSERDKARDNAYSAEKEVARFRDENVDLRQTVRNAEKEADAKFAAWRLSAERKLADERKQVELLERKKKYFINRLNEEKARVHKVKKENSSYVEELQNMYRRLEDATKDAAMWKKSYFTAYEECGRLRDALAGIKTAKVPDGGDTMFWVNTREGTPIKFYIPSSDAPTSYTPDPGSTNTATATNDGCNDAGKIDRELELVSERLREQFKVTAATPENIFSISINLKHKFTSNIHVAQLIVAVVERNSRVRELEAELKFTQAQIFRYTGNNELKKKLEEAVSEYEDLAAKRAKELQKCTALHSDRDELHTRLMHLGNAYTRAQEDRERMAKLHRREQDVNNKLRYELGKLKAELFALRPPKIVLHSNDDKEIWETAKHREWQCECGDTHIHIQRPKP